MISLVQLRHPREGRAVARVEGGALHLLEGYRSIYDLAQDALRQSQRLASLAQPSGKLRPLPYDEIYQGRSDWRLLPAFDHPDNPSACLVSGTGLTHKASAERRQAMHAKTAGRVTLTDSMKMFQWGLEGGRPQAGRIGSQPEWFYKGNGSILRGHGDELEAPGFADDGGEEPEVAGMYLVDQKGQPRRVGFATANEFSDHIMEQKNYLYLAPSKLRACAIGPELAVEADFSDVRGTVSIEREGRTLWSHEVATGEANMSHSLGNLEHHHFKYPQHRLAGDVHIHFFGADAFSFGESLRLQTGDVMQVHWPALGRALRNPLRVGERVETPTEVLPI